MSDDLTFFNELFNEYADLSERSVPNESIWHYTSLTGLKGITKSSKALSLWFTNKDYLNDSSEGQEIMQIFKKVCKDTYISGKISKDFYDTIKNVSLSTKKVFPNNGVLNIDEYQLYVCCFAREGDLLDLWRYYSKYERGYSLKFYTNIVNDIANKYRNKGINHVCAFNVIYSDLKKKELIQEKILKLYTIYQKYSCRNYPEKGKSIKAVLSYCLTLNQLMFKNNCFSSEKEFRIIISLPKNASSSTIKKEFRENNYFGFIPYIVLGIDNSRLLEIKMDPFQRNKYQFFALEEYCKEKGLPCKISQSKLPVIF